MQGTVSCELVIGTSKKRRMRTFLPTCLCTYVSQYLANDNIQYSTANTMYSKAAERSADIGDYPKAIELYEQVGDWSLGNSLTKYSVKDYWLRAALCSVAMGVSLRLHCIYLTDV